MPPIDSPAVGTPPAVQSPVAPSAPAEPTTAAEKYGWGTPLPESDEFDYTGGPDPAKWDTINGCWAGHNGNGKRCGDRSTVDGEKLIQTGLRNGDTGWLASKLDQQYGRWEARVRSFNTGESGKEYHPLLIVWPESDSWPQDGEYDFLENQAPGEECANAFIHYPHPRMPVQQEFLEEKDCGAPLSEWHTIAFEWTPDHVRGYIDGKEWYTLEDGAGPGGRKNIQDMPSGHLTIQFDNFHGGGMREASYEIDWVRIYSLDGAGQPAAGDPATTPGAGEPATEPGTGEPATGQDPSGSTSDPAASPASGGPGSGSGGSTPSGGDSSGGDSSGGDSSGSDSSGGDSSGKDPSGGDSSGGDASGDDSSHGHGSGEEPSSEGAMTEAAPAASATRASSFDAKDD
ncbi:glycoside hydrolase family 16 protein [Pseudonocardia yuanmonensis]|uniref:glycoside hydrolase family 16 protein n=1 Tax=Pseudonocardia yuanmonensis TaxID=1095914 RepID=UPI0031EDD1AF